MTTPTTTELVPFRGAAIEALMHEGRPWASIKGICGNLGMAHQRQMAKLRAKPWATITLMVTVAADGKAREQLCIDLDSLPMWLATIEPSRVKPEARDSLVAYQREAARVLRDHFLGRTQVASQPPELAPQLLAREARLEAREERLEAYLELVTASQARMELLQREQHVPEKLYTSKQMAAYLQVPESHWRKISASGQVDAAEVQLGDEWGTRRWDVGKVLALLSKRRAG